MPSNPSFNVAINLAASELQHFDSIGYLYIMGSQALDGALKIGITLKPPAIRALELSKELKRDVAFSVLGAWRFRNYRLAERFMQHHLYNVQQEFVKEVYHFNNIRTGEPCKRTHRSSEVFKCSFHDANKLVLQLLTCHDEVFVFERSVADQARRFSSLLTSPKRASFLEGLYVHRVRQCAQASFILNNVTRTMAERWEAGETSIREEKRKPPMQGEFGI
jgi:hypothetical protein